MPDEISPDILRIIIADDHDWIRQVIVRVVCQTLPGAAIYEAVDGLEALRFFERVSCHFLVSNHSMPRMDGMTLIRNVREQRPDLPIAMVSVNPDAEIDAMAAGANWFVIKEMITITLPELLLEHARIRAH